MELLQARVRVWGRPRGRSGTRAPRDSLTHSVREDARVGAGSDGGEEPNLAATNGEDVYDGVTFERRRVEAMVVGDADQELRLLGFDLRPVPAGTSCTIRVGRREFSCAANDQGIVRFKTSTQPEICHVSWSPQGNSDAEAAVVERRNVSLIAWDRSDIKARLFNLGYAHAELEQRVEAFQQEFRRKLTRQANDIAPEIEQWHDAGITPALATGTTAGVSAAAFAGSRGGGGSLGASGGRAKTTVAPVLKIEAVPGAPCVHWPPGNSAGQGPDTTRRTPDGSVWYMEVLRGSHSAVTFRGAQNLVIKPNNASNAICDAPDVWIDDNPNSDKRAIYFYAHRYPQDIAGGEPKHIDHTSLFEITDRDGVKRAPLQVKVRFYGRNYEGERSEARRRALHHVALQLYGNVFAVQSQEQRGLPPYTGFGERQLLVPTPPDPGQVMSPAQILRKINEYLYKNKTRFTELDHLVLQAHGGRDSNECYYFLGHDPVRFPDAASKPAQWRNDTQNIGFSRHNVDIWRNIQGRVRYIWIMGCTLGSDARLCSAIARNTGAWVTATMGFTGFRPPGLGTNQIEYLWDNALVHYDPGLPEAAVPALESSMQDWTTLQAPQDQFLRRARRQNTGRLEDDLAFNIVDLIRAPIGNMPP